MASWDRRSPSATASRQEALVAAQVVDAVAPFSPFWRERLAALGRTAADTGSLAGLAALPPVGERDVCPDGDPAGAAALVLQATETGFALHAEGPVLRRALLRRVAAPTSYARVVEQDTRPTSFVWAGLGMRFPVASTRGDLDVVARAGARLWAVLGLSRADVLVAAVEAAPTAVRQSLELAALGAGAPALLTADDADELAAALRLVPATVLALPSGTAATALDDLDEAGAALDSVRTVLLLGAPDPQERAQVRAALDRVGVSGAAVLAVHVPDGHRLAWGECREGGGETGLHGYPDLEVAHVVDPESGEAAASGELVLTQLGLRGSALVRWRTGDTVDGVTSERCPGCGRTVPRAVGLRRGALVPTLRLRSGSRAVDLRGVSAALAGSADVERSRVRVHVSDRDGADELLVDVVPAAGADPADVAVAVARDVRAAAGLLPTQVVLREADELLPA